MASPAIHAACVVRSVTDTTTTIVPPPPPSRASTVARGPLTRGPAWLGWTVAGLGFADARRPFSRSRCLPSSLVAEKENQRTGEMESTPYALTPASAEPVTDRITFGDLPDGVERYETDSDFYFVTVTSPTQTMLSWLAGRNDAAVRFITTEDKFGTRTPSQRTAINLQSMRTAEQEAQYVALTALGIDAEITPGEVVVEEMLCLTASDGRHGVRRVLPVRRTGRSGRHDPRGRRQERSDSVNDLVDALADKKPGDTRRVVDRPAGRG